MAQESRSSWRRDRGRSGGRDHRNDRAPRSGLDSLPPRPPPSAPRDGYRPPSSRADQYPRESASRYETRSRDDHGRRDPPASTSNSYRPPQSDFTFRAEKPSGVRDFGADSYRPQDDRSFGNRRDQDARRNPRGGYGNRGRDRAGQRGRGSGSRPRRPFVPAERELLNTAHSTGPEVALYKEGGATFRPVDELSDSEEAEMDISGDEDQGASEPSKKRTRLARDAADGDSVPKWSNPDPYTAIPPGEAAPPNKKRDVVHLIRKARVVTTTENKSSIPTEAADFIACDSSDEGEDEGEDSATFAQADSTAQPRAPGMPGAPTGPRATVDTRSQAEIYGAPPTISQDSAAQNFKEKMSDPLNSQDHLSISLGIRKRTHDDVIKKAPDVRLGKPTPIPGGSKAAEIVSAWAPKKNEDCTPWMVTDHSDCRLGGVWLHKEIIDFYEYVRPRDFEVRARQEIIDDLKRCCRNFWGDAEAYCFGSFPTGLYLPTSDMDLVVLSDQVLKGTGRAKYTERRSLYKFGDHLRKTGRVYNSEIEFILFARVPLVKFVESRTRLKVDISFENPGGLQAVKTFNAWKEQYPAMPILVTLIKHLLCMRGLNEPVNGGIGGFSVICLVVSMLQLMPEVQSRSMDPMHHLGDLLINFLDLYGNQFNYKLVAISVNPPKYIDKNKVRTFTYKNHDRLSIIDPNNPENDIAGGSSKFHIIQATFRELHAVLRERVLAATQTRNQGYSILKDLLGGNYFSFRRQRLHLEKLSKER
ncbi:hypothetical protein QBC34DRAFT_404448 [Podospora aff. communis PSN243]|uniref:polynucleotide adenylyltransferase n=1 Tax=Podospora aff. communis PSN243 TaxID=3040156 RepID=A0AAV9GSI2_9PEZI|nr:hypothetical protein QBC34DRAFT_404448 [Podospora aff. communis PSN243]